MADAGGNDLLKVDRRGHTRVLAVFPPRLVPAPEGVPDLPPQIPMQAVPTSVVKGPDGAYYVGQLTGFRFPVGAANVLRAVPGHRPRVFAGRFVLGHGAAYLTNNSVLPGAGQVVKVDL